MTTETTMKKREWRLCRVEAKPWKGMVASAPYHGVKALRVNKKRLVQVVVEGHAEAVTLKYSHLTFFAPGSLFEGSIQVTPGRFQCVASALHKGKRLWQGAVGGRASGNLMAMKAHLKAHVSRKSTREEGGMIVQCTDLNVAMAINQVAAGGEASLSPSHEEMFQPLQDQIRRLVKKKSVYKKIFKSDIKPRQNTSSSIIFAKYRPQYLQPDNNFDRKLGDARINAVKRGAFKIYPCPLYEHVMEVRYLDDGAADTLIVRQEIYLDYGAEEVESYILNAVALGDTDRLLPSTLSKVDPQAFWSVLLHSEKSRETLQQSTQSQLCSAWDKIWQGVMSSQQRWLQEAGTSMIASRMPQSIIRGDYLPDWGIANKRDLEDVSFACAYITLLVMIKAAICLNQSTKSPTMEFQMLDCYNNTQIARFVSVVQTLLGRSSNMKQVLEHAVFGKREDDTYLDFCGNCGNPAKQQYCGRCSGVAYCCRKCQVEDWKTHKKECSEVLAQTKRAVYRLHKKLGELDGHRDPA